MIGVLKSVVSVTIVLSFFAQTVKAQVENSFPTITPTPKVAIEYSLPYPGILPNHPLYFLKQARDRILLWLTTEREKKSNVYLLLADKHLVMGGMLYEKGLYDLSVNTLKTGEKYLLDSVLILTDGENADGLSPGLTDKLELAVKKHEEQITTLKEKEEQEKSRVELNEVLGITHQAIQKLTILRTKT